MDFTETGLGAVDWIGMAQHKEKWRALVNAVMNSWVPYNARKLSSDTKPMGSRVVFSSIELVMNMTTTDSSDQPATWS
jgi:hypothetical protein